MIDTLIDTYFGNKNVIYSGMAEPIFNWGLGGGGGGWGSGAILPQKILKSQCCDRSSHKVGVKVYFDLQKHLMGSLESNTREAGVLSCSPNFLHASFYNSIRTR